MASGFGGCWGNEAPCHFKSLRKSFHIVDWCKGWLQQLMFACLSSEWERRSRWLSRMQQAGRELFLGCSASSERLASRPSYSLFSFLFPPPQIWMTWSVISPAECASLYLLLAKLLYELAVLLAMYDMALAFSQRHVKL